MTALILGGLAFGVLVWVGRHPWSLSQGGRIASASFAAAAAIGAVAAGLRGGWMVSLCLIALSAWLARGSARRAAPGAGAGETMSAAEARSILGVSETATTAEIEAAFRRLMQRAHPDHGGSTGLAAQLNAARDRLSRPGRA